MNTRSGDAINMKNFIGAQSSYKNINRAFDVEARVSWQRIGYDETTPLDGKSGFELQNYGRGLEASEMIFSGDQHKVTYTFYPNKNTALYNQGVCRLFVMAGAGVFITENQWQTYLMVQ